jgi:hypothetical protein
MQTLCQKWHFCGKTGLGWGEIFKNILITTTYNQPVYCVSGKRTGLAAWITAPLGWFLVKRLAKRKP